MRGLFALLGAGLAGGGATAAGDPVVLNSESAAPVRWRVANDGWMTYPSGPTRSPGSQQRRARKRARWGGGR